MAARMVCSTICRAFSGSRWRVSTSTTRTVSSSWSAAQYAGFVVTTVGIPAAANCAPVSSPPVKSAARTSSFLMVRSKSQSCAMCIILKHSPVVLNPYFYYIQILQSHKSIYEIFCFNLKHFLASPKNYDIIYKKGKQLGGQRHGQSDEGIGRRAL